MITTTKSGKQQIQVYTASITNVGTGQPVVEVLKNSIHPDLEWIRVAQGWYTLGAPVDLVWSGKVHIEGMVAGNTNTLGLMPIGMIEGGVTTIEGYYTIIKSTDAILSLMVYNEALVMTDLGTIVGTNKINLPEIRVYNN